MKKAGKKFLIAVAALVPVAAALFLTARLVGVDKVESTAKQWARDILRQIDGEAPPAPAAAPQDKEPSGQMRVAVSTLVKDLDKELTTKEVRIQQTREKLEINFLDRLLFASGSAEITPRGKEILAKLSQALKHVDDKKIYVIGHTDNVPISSAAYPSNWELSTARACSVIRLLTEKGGVDPRLFFAMGRGEQHPVDDNRTDKGRTENRRVEVIVANIPSLEPAAREEGAAEGGAGPITSRTIEEPSPAPDAAPGSDAKPSPPASGQ